MEDDLKSLLQSVASGEISPDDAAQRIGQRTQDSVAIPQEPLRRIIIKAGAVRLNIHGDPGVAQAVAQGPHTMRREGDAPLSWHGWVRW
jgi:hypothetical protein